MKITTRFLYIDIFLLAAALATATVCFLAEVRAGAEQWALREQEQHLKTFWTLLESKGKGYRVSNGTLFVGDTPLNGRNDLPDTVSGIFGGTATIFMGDRRIATNVLSENGTRAIGTALAGPPHEALFKEGRGYRGAALVLGVPSLAAYDPIKNASGETIGALYVGTPKSAYLGVYERFRAKVAVLSTLLALLFSLFAFLVMRLHKAEEKELHHSTAKFRQLFELQSDAVIVADTAGGSIIEANHTATVLYGFSRQELGGMKIDLLCADAGALPSGGWSLSSRHRKKDGTVVPVEVRVSRAQWEGRDVTVAAIRDVTERERAEEALRAGRERLRLAVEIARLGQWEYDVASGVFCFNDEFYALCGTTAEEEGGYFMPPDRYLRKFVPADEAQLVAQRMEQALVQCDPNFTNEVEHPIVRADGEKRHMVVRYRLECDQEGRCLKIFGASQDITEMRRAELATRESYQLFRAAFDIIPDYISISTLEEGLFVDVNPGFTRIIGFRREEVIGRSALDLGIWARPEERRALLELLDERGFADSVEGTFRHKDGHLLTVAVSAGTVRLQGRTFLLGFIKDVTEKKRAERAMSHLNRTLRTLTKCNEALVRAENESQLLDDLCRLIVEEGGYRFAWVAYAQEDEGRTIRAVAQAGECRGYLESLSIVRAGTDRESDPVQTAICTGAPTYIRDTADGSSFTRWRERAREQGYRSMLAVPLLPTAQHGSLNIYAAEPDAFDEEEVELMVQLANDMAYGITALRTRISHQQASHALLATAEEYRTLATSRDQERALLRALLDSIPDLIFFKDHSSIYLGCNKAFDAFAGRSERQLSGLSDFDLFPEEVARLFTEMDRQMMARRESRRNEEWVYYPDGRHVLLETLKTPFYDEEGAVRGLIGISRDITERHQAEEDRANLEAQLHQSQKMEAVGQLAGGIAHDFNNILTAIMGYSDILASRLEGGSALRGYAEQVQLATARAAELTARLLAFSRKQVLRTKPLEVRQVVRDFEKMLARIIPEDIEFTVRLPEEDLIVMGDRGQLEQVLMNLVTNAKDALPHGGRLLIMAQRASIDARFIHEHGFGRVGDYACLSVADTGAGMDEETKRRIFEPFFTTKELGKGTGLGMAISYGIVKQHNGFITVHSELKAGTTFRIYLPLVSEVQKEAEPQREEYRTSGGSEGILLAEDDEAVRQLNRMTLEQAGYRVVEAVDGQDALEKFLARQDEIDLLATDVVMPKLDGKALYEEIRRVRPQIAALFMSGYTNDIVIKRGVIAGDFTLLNKPFPPGELLKTVRALLDQKGG